MAKRKDSESLDRELQDQANSMTSCPICMETFNTPKILPCQHTFCLDCLKHHLAAVNSSRLAPTSNFPCPTCRKTCYVPSGGMEQLSNDIKVGQIRDLLSIMENSRSVVRSPSSASSAPVSPKTPTSTSGKQDAVSLCAICRYQGNDRPADSFCVDCTKLMCSKCRSHHTETTIFRGHGVYELSGSKERSTTLLCKTHHSEYIYFCERCKVPLCSVCVMLPDHDKHEIKNQKSDSTPAHTSPGNSAENVQTNSDIDSFLKMLESRGREYVGRIETVKSLKEEHAKAYAEAESLAKKSMDDAIKKVKETYNSMIKDLKTHRDEKIHGLTAIEKTLVARQSTMKGLQSELLAKGSTKQKNMQRQVQQELDESVPIIDTALSDCIVFNSNVQVQIGQMEIRALEAKATSEAVVTNMKRGFWNLPSFRRQGAIKSETNQPQQPKEDEITQLNSIQNVRKDATIRNLVNRVSRRAVSAAPLAAVPRSDDCCGSNNGPRLFQWKTDDFVSCKDCCFIDENKVAATDNQSSSGDRIKIFDASNGEKIHFFASSDIVEPWGICYNKITHTLQAVSQSNCSVKGLKPKGMKETPLSKLETTNKPIGIAVTSKGDYVVTDAGKVIIFSSKFKKINEFGMDDIGKANYVVVDHNDRIIVSDFESHYIKIFNKSGESLLRFSSCGPGGKEMIPQGLAVDDSNNIIVADQAIRSVSMYSNDGELIDNLVETIGVPWGISFCAEKKLLAVATDKGLEVYKL